MVVVEHRWRWKYVEGCDHVAYFRYVECRGLELEADGVLRLWLLL